MDNNTFNPYIHGTNSSILAFLPRTGFKLTSPIDLLERYSLAPMSGEIFCGGLRGLASKCQPCFTTLGEQRNYTKEKIINKYARMAHEIPTRATLQEKIKYNLSHKLSQTNELIVMIARARQWQVMPGEEIASMPEILALMEYFKSLKQLYYALICIAKYHDFSSPLVTRVSQTLQGEHWDALDNYFTVNNLIELLKELKIDLSVAYANASNEGLMALSKVFSLSLDGIANANNNIFALSTANAKEILPSEGWEKKRNNGPKVQAYDFLHGEKDKMLDSIFLYAITEPFEHEKEEKWYESICHYILKYLDILNARFSLLEKILDTKKEHFTFSEEEMSLIENSFPIILICEQEDVMKKIDDEYRANRELTLGTDILMVATDNPKNQKCIQQWLAKYNRPNVNVILFDELQLDQRPIISQSVDVPKPVTLLFSKTQNLSDLSQDFHSETIKQFKNANLL